MSKPALAAGLLVLMAGAWYWAPVPTAPPVPAARPDDARRPGAHAGVPTLRLGRLASAPPGLPGREGRNPFAAGAPVASAGAPREGPRISAAVASAADAPPPPPAWPSLVLIGVAEGTEGAALVRTAIVSGPRGVHHLRPGDVVEGVYRVERIASEVVEVRLLPENRLVRLPLRP